MRFLISKILIRERERGASFWSRDSRIAEPHLVAFRELQRFQITIHQSTLKLEHKALSVRGGGPAQPLSSLTLRSSRVAHLSIELGRYGFKETRIWCAGTLRTWGT